MMKNKSLGKRSFLLSIPLLSLGLGACHHSPGNAEMQQTINDSLQANPNTKNVSAAVSNGIVTLTGTCSGDNCVTATETKIKNIEGVTTVQNKVLLTPQNTDLTLRTQVQSIATKYAGVQADVTSGVIVLRGSIDRDQLPPLMAELKNVQASKIDNQLAVK